MFKLMIKLDKKYLAPTTYKDIDSGEKAIELAQKLEKTLREKAPGFRVLIFPQEASHMVLLKVEGGIVDFMTYSANPDTVAIDVADFDNIDRGEETLDPIYEWNTRKMKS